MKYLELIKSQVSTSTCVEAGNEFSIRRHDELKDWWFTSFRNNELNNAERESLKTNWKARISIHPEDFLSAWDIFSPHLFKQSVSFKVVDIKKLSDWEIEENKNWDLLFSMEQECLHGHDTTHIARLRDFGFKLFDILTPSTDTGFIPRLKYYLKSTLNYFRLNFTPESYVNSYVNSQHKILLEKYQLKKTHHERFANGMQVTIYMCPGMEKQQLHMLEKIEHELIQNGVRPGIIYPTDRALGHYISIRHPGKNTYHDAVMVKKYNPDNEHDPFDEISPITIAASYEFVGSLNRRSFENNLTTQLKDNAYRRIPPAYSFLNEMSSCIKTDEITESSCSMMFL